MIFALILIGILALIVLVIVGYVNRIVVLSNRIDNAWSQIDVQLKKRTDLLPNLVETVKGYAKHEREVFEMVAKARENMMKAGNDVKSRAKAENQLTSALKTIFALSERYPKLMANENFKLLQEQLEGIENKVAYSRQFYNDAVLEFNNVITTIPGVWFAGLMGKKAKDYFETEEAERKPIKVKF